MEHLLTEEFFNKINEKIISKDLKNIDNNKYVIKFLYKDKKVSLKLKRSDRTKSLGIKFGENWFGSHHDINYKEYLYKHGFYEIEKGCSFFEHHIASDLYKFLFILIDGELEKYIELMNKQEETNLLDLFYSHRDHIRRKPIGSVVPPGPSPRVIKNDLLMGDSGW